MRRTESRQKDTAQEPTNLSQFERNQYGEDVVYHRSFAGLRPYLGRSRTQVTATARKLDDVADLTARFGDAALPLALDVTNPEQVKQVVNQAYAHFGRLDVLVNNAGTSLFAATEEASDEQIRYLFDANYLGMVRVLRAALPLLREQRSGHILGVSSGLGITALPLIGFYCATKWAVEALSTNRLRRR